MTQEHAIKMPAYLRGMATIPPARCPSLDVLGANVRRKRTRLGYSRNDISLATGLSRLTVQNIELGRAKPRVTTLVKLAEALNVTAALLLRGKKGS